ncbi:heavy metal-binding domain-containing protein [Cytophaga aurantiaca]|uniref:heavy metal-binding domain-containing protein n=1 Tax=Cytophaga aurantiaca TaxID=29530 RepID=UPI0014613F3B|nr:heavy metal-binding domain-containing protein [Cytophaga aurantiaca]
MLSFVITSCQSNDTKVKSPENMDMNTESSVQYTCPMHPEVLSDKPGTCPKCGMDLVKKEAAIKADSSMKM